MEILLNGSLSRPGHYLKAINIMSSNFGFPTPIPFFNSHLDFHFPIPFEGLIFILQFSSSIFFQQGVALNSPFDLFSDVVQM